MSGLAWHVGLIRRLLELFPSRIAGLKDSSGDMSFARAAAAISRDFAVFPSTEAALLEARRGDFAGCISATANCNADLCARAWASGDQAALEAAVAIRKLFDGKPLVSGVKALLAHIHGDPALARVKPPLVAFSAAERGAVAGERPSAYKPRPRRQVFAVRVFLKNPAVFCGISAAARRRKSDRWPIPSPPAKPRARSRAAPGSTRRAARPCARRCARWKTPSRAATGMRPWQHSGKPNRSSCVLRSGAPFIATRPVARSPASRIASPNSEHSRACPVPRRFAPDRAPLD